MQGILGNPLEEPLATIPQESDTASSRTHIPIYFIHSFEHPFCKDTACQCHRQEKEADKLFVKIIEGHLELEQAALFLEAGVQQ